MEAATAPLESADDRLQGLVRASTLPLFVVRLSDSMVLEVSDETAAIAGRSREQLLTTKLRDFVEDPEGAVQSLHLLAEGKIDGYTRRGGYLRPDGEYVQLEARYNAYADECPRTVAVGMVLSEVDRAAFLELGEPRAEESFVLGTVDHDWRIDRVTSDVAEVLRSPPEELLGNSALAAVHPEDVSLLLLLAAHSSGQAGGASGRIRLRSGDGGWVTCRVVILPLAGASPAAFAFALTPVRAPQAPDFARVRDLEEHLRRIAREVSASGVAAFSNVFPTARELPELSSVTAREYEVLVRLASGDRVSKIARALFLSESTVRNHLTSLYRKFGVRSQAELLARVHAS